MEFTASEAWTSITASAREVLPEQTIRTWLTPTEAVALSEDTLVVAAPTRFAVEWIEDKYGDLLRQLVQRELGPEMVLQFEHKGSSDRIEFPELRGPSEGEDSEIAGHELDSVRGPVADASTIDRSSAEAAR
jgi:chromosomal replication initiator protein